MYCTYAVYVEAAKGSVVLSLSGISLSNNNQKNGDRLGN